MLRAVGERIGSFAPIMGRQVLVVVGVLSLGFSVVRSKPLMVQLGQDTSDATQSAPLSPEALQRLVAPIALYPDALVAQILAASTYPTEIVEADRWLQNHSNLDDEKLAEEVDKQSWDPGIKALTNFPSVLANLDSNLSWTSSLGDAYFNQQQDALDAIQVLRVRAKDAGNLESTPQQTVTNQGTTIIIQPADPDVCYVPTYNPLLVYGDPIGIYPGYVYDSVVGAPFISFGIGFGIGGGFRRGFGWGFHSWNCNWIGHNVIFNHNPYVSRSPAFFHRFPGSRGGGNFGRGPGGSVFQGGNHQSGNFDRGRGNGADGFHDRNFDPNRNQGFPNPNFDRDRGGAGFPPGTRSGHDFRGFGQRGSGPGTRSGAFSGIGPGGIERGSASRGRDSFGRGGGLGSGIGIGNGRGIGGGRGFGGGFGGGGNRGGGGGRAGGRH